MLKRLLILSSICLAAVVCFDSAMSYKTRYERRRQQIIKIGTSPEFQKCFPSYYETMTKFKYYEQVPVDDYLAIQSACPKVFKCINRPEMETMEQFCFNLEYLTVEIRSCLFKFFRSTYIAQSSNEASCLKDYEFLAKDFNQRYFAHSKGKSCVMEYIQHNCDDTSVVFFNKNYELVSEAIRDVPVNGNHCDEREPHYEIVEAHCAALRGRYLTAKSYFESVYNDTMGGPETKKVIQMCRDSQACMHDECDFPSYVFNKISKGCNKFAMKHSAFSKCWQKLNAEKPDVSKLTCVEGHDFYDDKRVCQWFTEKKNCLKTIFAESCEEDAVYDFDSMVINYRNKYNCELN